MCKQYFESSHHTCSTHKAVDKNSILPVAQAKHLDSSLFLTTHIQTVNLVCPIQFSTSTPLVQGTIVSKLYHHNNFLIRLLAFAFAFYSPLFFYSLPAA